MRYVLITELSEDTCTCTCLVFSFYDEQNLKSRECNHEMQILGVCSSPQVDMFVNRTLLFYFPAIKANILVSWPAAVELQQSVGLE